MDNDQIISELWKKKQLEFDHEGLLIKADSGQVIAKAMVNGTKDSIPQEMGEEMAVELYRKGWLTS